MRSLAVCGLGAMFVLGGIAAHAADLKSGIPVGEFVPAFDVIKHSGAIDDGVKAGDRLCYR